jgi:hypothetical protein
MLAPASDTIPFWDIQPGEFPPVTYRLFDSDVGWCDTTVSGFGFLVEAMRASGMRQPRRAQFQSQGQWIDVSQFALLRAIKESQKELPA